MHRRPFFKGGMVWLEGMHTFTFCDDASGADRQFGAKLAPVEDFVSRTTSVCLIEAGQELGCAWAMRGSSVWKFRSDNRR